ncbi:hypothetical protein CBR_g52341 [Chara braunii]|uniref:Uncharacterized protein n=1 Tax=Chara braunii TaxID=69332 RepID=A0A388K6U4_CHABU|nr:hypothetical protein CBR_g52341 [Chara braunii]|eukprot:GBG65749.1 hypothetical protein CBR_g52341 [Chara braunii]
MWRTCHVAMGEGWQRRGADAAWRWERDGNAEVAMGSGAGSGSEGGHGCRIGIGKRRWRWVPHFAHAKHRTWRMCHVPHFPHRHVTYLPHHLVPRGKYGGGDAEVATGAGWRRHLGVEVAYLPHHLVPRASAKVATPSWRRERQVRHVASAASPYSPGWQVLRWRRERQVRHVASAAAPYSPTWQVRRWRRRGGDGIGIGKRRWRRQDGDAGRGIGSGIGKRRWRRTARDQ